MVQGLDNSVSKPVYNAVKINIKNPTVNKAQTNSVSDDNGIYNAVSIDVDNPSVNTNAQKVYSYPEADNLVTYDMIKPATLPQGFHVAYQTTNVILPKIENEVELNDKVAPAEDEIVAEDVQEDFVIIDVPEEEVVEEVVLLNVDDVDAEEENIIVPVEEQNDETEASGDVVVVPEPNFTTVEAEKSPFAIGFRAAENVKRPEIIPGEEIKPEVDIPLVVSNLANKDFDIQAQQMEEIARISLDDKENAVPYIVREVFSGLIEITKKDTANLAMPTPEQVDARRKVIANYLAREAGNQKASYELTDRDVALANEISPMEQAERNKEYALYTIAILAKVYTNEVERQTGNIVPMTDIPGASAIVDALRYNPNSGVKVAAIDSLSHIQRPEYKEELTTLFTLAQADRNPEVSMAASRALDKLN